MYIIYETLFLIQNFQLEAWQRGGIFEIITNNCNMHKEKLYIKSKTKRNFVRSMKLAWNSLFILFFSQNTECCVVPQFCLFA